MGERTGKLKELFRKLSAYGGMTALSFAVNLGLTVGLHEFYGFPEEASYAVALAAVFGMNFLISRHIVFRAASGSPGRQGLLFFLTSIGFRAIEYLLFLLVHSVLGVWYVAAVICIAAPMTLVKFVFHGKVVFVPES